MPLMICVQGEERKEWHRAEHLLCTTQCDFVSQALTVGITPPVSTNLEDRHVVLTHQNLTVVKQGFELWFQILVSLLDLFVY